jgi:hypothetical protein
MLRYLRIAFSVTCGIACVLLILLWVRSYWIDDALSLPTEGTTMLCSIEGRVFMQRLRQQKIDPSGWRWTASELDELPEDFGSGPTLYYHSNSANTWAGVPHWFAVIVAGTLGGLPWIRWRFSLRTLLITTTLMAVVLGLIVYACRQ